MILSDICEFIVDCPHSTAPDEGAGYPLIRTPNIGKGRLILDGVHRVSEKVYEERTQRGIPQDGDLIFAREAPAGNVALVTNGEKVCLGQRTVLIRPKQEEVNPEFLVYYLLSPQQQYELLGTANGATVAHVNLPVIRNLPINIPERCVQDKIANILSSFDNLIENNQKQIKLLEEAAQRLYKEWFVDLRFPGYEEVEIIDGVPEGWKRTTIGEFLGVRSGYAFKSGWWQDSGYPVVKIKDINNNTVDISSLDHVAPEHTSKIPEFKLDKGDIVIAMTGATIGKIGLVPEVDNLYTNQRVGKVFPNAELLIPTPFVFCFYGQKSILEQIIALSSSSSAQPNISGGQLESFEVIANIDIINKFGKNMQPHFDKINDLYKQNRLLTQARDRLLPKLMNGEIEV